MRIQIWPLAKPLIRSHRGCLPSGLVSLLAITLLMIAKLTEAAATDKPQPLVVVTSIQPLYLVAKEVLPKDINVERLLPPGASPHGFQLSVSERRLLDKADLVAWVGPNMEAFLAPLLRRKNHLQIDTLASVRGAHSTHSTHDDHDHHNHGQKNGIDPHLWLNPENIMVFARTLVEELEPLLDDRESKLQLRANLERFNSDLLAYDQKWQQQLQGFADKPWLVYHDALRHLQGHFHLLPYQVVTVSPDKRPGAKHLYQLRKQLKPGQCLLVEDYYPTRQAQKLAQEFNLNQFTIDPLGVHAQTYGQLMQDLVDQLSRCFAAYNQI